MKFRLFEHATLTTIGLLILAWPLFGMSQEISSSAGEAAASPEEADSVSIYETLVFDAPIALSPAGTGELFNREPTRSELTQSTSTFGLRPGSMQNLQISINAIELEGGAWDLGLAENLTRMAEIYQGQGAYEEAIDTYSRAMHVSRVNLGLNSLEHVPIVERLVDTYLAKGDLAGADQYQEYLYYTQRQAYGMEDPRMVPVLDRLARWKLNLFNVRWGDELGLTLISALRLYQTASDIVSVHFGKQDERYEKYLRDTAGTAYLLARNKGLLEETPNPEFRVIQDRYPGRTTQYSPSYIEGYEEGLEALQAMVESYQGEVPGSLEHVRALTLLADWYLLFDRHRSAQANYQEAYNHLAARENGAELILENFATVKPLPDFSDDIEQIFVRATVDGRKEFAVKSGHIDVQFDVTAYGSVTGLKLLTDESDTDPRVISLLRRKVRSTVFRPTVVDGGVVRSLGNRFRYRYVY